jgi:hypothetical protein
MIQLFNSAYYLGYVLSIMYLFSNGREFMKQLAKKSCRPFLLYIILMSLIASAALYGAFYPQESTMLVYLFGSPFLLYLIHLTILSKNHKI